MNGVGDGCFANVNEGKEEFGIAEFGIAVAGRVLVDGPRLPEAGIEPGGTRNSETAGEESAREGRNKKMI